MKYYVKSGEVELVTNAISPLDAAVKAISEAPCNVGTDIVVHVDECGFRPRKLDVGEAVGPNEVVLAQPDGNYLMPLHTFDIQQVFAAMGISTEPDDLHLATDDDNTLDV